MMTSTKHLLIGGGLACSQAAKMLRMKESGSSITLTSKELHLPYDRPPLSKELLRGEKSIEQVIYDPPRFFEDKNIGVILGNPVVALDTHVKTVELAGGEVIQFEKAFIATGGDPLRLNIPGAKLAGVYYLRTMEDARRIASEAGPGRRAVVIGAGFIGMEVAASLTHAGVDVTVIETLPHIWPRFLDTTLAKYVQDHCETRGIRLCDRRQTPRAARSRPRSLCAYRIGYANRV